MLENSRMTQTDQEIAGSVRFFRSLLGQPSFHLSPNSIRRGGLSSNVPGKRLIGQDYAEAAIQVEKLSIQLARKYDVDILCYANSLSWRSGQSNQPFIQVETD